MPAQNRLAPALAAGFLIALLALCAPGVRAQAPPAAKIKVGLRSQLPTHLYPINGKASDLVQDPAHVLALAAKVKADINDDLKKYDITDAPTLRAFHSTLSAVDLLEQDYPDALAETATVRGLEDKPSEKLVSGLTTTALINTLQHPGVDFHATLQTNLRAALASVPYAEAEDEFKHRKGAIALLASNLVISQIAVTADPAAEGGQIGQDVAVTLLNAALTLEYVIPNKSDYLAAYNAVIEANASIQKPDIWTARDLALPPSPQLTPVVVGIWDSGVDVSLYRKNLWTNPHAGRDGYKGDLHGIAFTLAGDPSPDLLMPWSGETGDRLGYESDLIGYQDVTANIDSPDADALRATLASLSKDRLRPFLEGMAQYGNYAHGTHVTGIAIRGNPAARVLVCRITFDYHLVPMTPTVAQATKDAAAQAASIAYFKAHDVRAVNISWGATLQDVEYAMEVNSAGGTPDARKKLARQIFEIGYQGLYDAIKNAPGILFVTAAGNGNDNVNFDETLPSSFKLPNVIVAGAVDQAGDQTSFTSFGNVDVYSDGFEVPSLVPGGKIAKLSGTSMAAPQVTNLAAKLFALNPSLTPTEAKRLIIAGSDRKVVNGKTTLLIDPKKTLDPLLRADHLASAGTASTAP